eukprot:9734674-Karenia_brevis.AAC.1
MGIPFPEFPAFPSYTVSGGWGNGAGRLQDYNLGLRMIQVKYGVREERLATSQGLKATVLAWANSFGIS